MSNAKSSPINMFTCCFGMLLFASCSGGRAPENKTAAADTVAKPRWIDPQKGKIWGKINVIEIPLTAIENHILGPVKSVTYKDYKISGKDGAKVLNDSGYNVYDKYGHLIDQNEYKADGTPKWNCVYKYDDQNKATLWDFKVYDDNYITKTTFKYDDKGNKIEQNEVDPNKKYSRRVVYKYDDKGNEIEETAYDADGKINMLTAYTYDNRGFQIGYTMRKGDGLLVSKMTQEYDNYGNKIGGTSSRSDTSIDGKWTSVIDNKGKITTTVGYDKDGKVRATIKEKYDDRDNLIEYVTYRPDGSIDTSGWNTYTDFEYDNNGNAIKETEYKLKSGKKVMTEVAERKFGYYE